MEGDAEANYAYFALHKLHWSPSYFLALDPLEKAFVIAAIDVRTEKEKKEIKTVNSTPRVPGRHSGRKSSRRHR